MIKFLKIPIYYSTDDSGVIHFDTESMNKHFETEIKKLNNKSFKNE